MCRPVAKCPKCGKVKKMTIHHCLPKIHYKGTGKTVYICRECHNELETFILKHEGKTEGKRNKLSQSMYISIYETFIRTKKLNVKIEPDENNSLLPSA